MSLAEGFLIVIVIVLTIWIFTKGPGAKASSSVWDCVDRQSGEVATVKVQQKKCSPEKAAQSEQAEYFSTLSDATMQCVMDNACGDGESFQYAVNEFGKPGADYKDWIAERSIDSQTMKNHAEFVKDRMEKQTSTGPTSGQMRGEMEASSSGPGWVGLRRPQHVPRSGDEAQQTDSDESYFTDKSTLVWRSTGNN